MRHIHLNIDLPARDGNPDRETMEFGRVQAVLDCWGDLQQSHPQHTTSQQYEDRRPLYNLLRPSTPQCPRNRVEVAAADYIESASGENGGYLAYRAYKVVFTTYTGAIIRLSWGRMHDVVGVNIDILFDRDSYIQAAKVLEAWARGGEALAWGEGEYLAAEAAGFNEAPT